MPTFKEKNTKKIHIDKNKTITLDFKHNEIEKLNINSNDLSYSKKIIYPKKIELEKHKQYLKSNFKKNFF